MPLSARCIEFQLSSSSLIDLALYVDILGNAATATAHPLIRRDELSGAIWNEEFRLRSLANEVGRSGLT